MSGLGVWPGALVRPKRGPHVGRTVRVIACAESVPDFEHDDGRMVWCTYASDDGAIAGTERARQLEPLPEGGREGEETV